MKRVALLVGALACVLAGGSSPSGAATAFHASAGGEVVRVGYVMQPGVVVEQFLDPGAAVAQVALDSAGTSTGFASTPFPGTLPVAMPGLLAGLAGIPAPPYPLVASSTYPATPESHADYAPVALAGRSQATQTEASARDGANETVARAALEPGGGAVVASAASTIAALEVPNLVQINGFRSSANARRTLGGGLERHADLVGRLTILGQSLRLTPSGLEVLGQAVPVGPAPSNSVGPLLAQLREHGVDLTVLAPVEVEDGLLSGGLQVVMRTEVPNYGLATTTFTIGRTFAFISDRALSGGLDTPLADVTTVPPAGNGSQGVVWPGAEAGVTGPVNVGSDPGVAAPTGAATGTGPGAAVGGGGGGEFAASPPPAGGLPAPGPARILAIDRTPVFHLYPVLVGVALGLAVLSHLFRRLGGTP